MIKKQQKWIALLVVCTFMWLLQVSTMPLAAAGTTAQVSSANAEQGPDYVEAVSHRAAPVKKKSMLPIILIAAGLVTITILVVVLVVLKSYNIVGTWNFQLTSTTYPGENSNWDMMFSGSKTSGTFVDTDGYTGTYSVDGKNITSIRYNVISISFTGKFDGKDKISGNYTWTYYSEVGTWTGTRSGSGASMPKSPLSFKEKKDREMLSK